MNDDAVRPAEDDLARLEGLPRFLLVRRLIRNGVLVQIEDAATRRFVASNRSGARVVVPAGRLSEEQVRALLDDLDIGWAEFLEMR